MIPHANTAATTRTPPLVVIARTRRAAAGALRAEDIEQAIEQEGSNRLAARARGAYLMWGVIPSPLALKTAENLLGLYKREDDPPPRFFYACYAGTHSSILAASLHLGLLADGRRVSDLPLFDRRIHTEVGVPALLGVDGAGAEVYALGTGWLSESLERPLCDLIEVASPRALACVCSVRGFLSFPARVGGFASRRCYLVWPGRGMIASSLARKVPDIGRAVRFCLDLSRRWKDNEGQPKGEVIWVDGSKAGRPRIGSPRGESGGVPGD